MLTYKLTDPLPTKTVVLEASAGTGKTYTLASLAVRYLAEGIVRLPQLLLITFSRLATAELRSRVRDRISEAVDALSGLGPSNADDEVLTYLCDAPADARSERCARLTHALAEFDAATIATTHEFCRRMILRLGILADTDLSPNFTADARPLAREAAADLYVRAYRNSSPPFPFASTWGSKTPAQQIASQVVMEPAARIVPPDAGASASARVSFATDVRAEVEERKKTRNLFTYDDQLTRLRDALENPATGEAARDRLADNFAVVLVDEFQDTDPIQWSILWNAFHGRRPLVLIGDPKQAIYGFRGADIGTYQAAVASAETTYALTTNYRSDAALVDAVDQIFAEADIGSGISVNSVTPAISTRRVQAEEPHLTLPFRIRGAAPVSPPLTRMQAHQVIVTDVVAEVTELLTSDVTVMVEGHQRSLAARDIAVLTQTNAMAQRIALALRKAGVLTVVTGSDSLYSSPAAHHWHTLLHALGQQKSSAIRSAALTPFVGLSIYQLASTSDVRMAELRQTTSAWAEVWNTYGVAALWETMCSAPDFASQLTTEPDADRLMADLRHVATELVSAESMGFTGARLCSWLEQRISESPDVPRHLARQDDAVRVMTIHRAKGLEFPFVLLPDVSFRSHLARTDDTIVFHDSEHNRCLDVGGGTAPGRGARMNAARAESDAETLRELYVALTRAQLGVIAWWVPEKTTRQSPLHRILSRPSNEATVAATYELDRLILRADRPDVSFERIPVPPRTARTLPSVNPALINSVRVFDRAIDPWWRRTSYSGLTASAHDDLHNTRVVAYDEPEEDPESESASLPDLTRMVSVFADLPRGAQFGTVVHDALETADFHSPDLEQELIRASTQALSRSGLALTQTQLSTSLMPVLNTPLGPLFSDRRLTDFARPHRLSELSFDMPLSEFGSATIHSIADLCDTFLLPEDPLAAYPQRLRELEDSQAPLRGVLTGSIDVVLRVWPENRYVVVDYKTNTIGGQQQYVDEYHDEALATAMIDNHYPLQALLYCVALHRFLRWRLPHYSPENHLGGVGYLFVRGMAGPAHPGSGVFSWSPPPQLICALSDALAGFARGRNGS